MKLSPHLSSLLFGSTLWLASSLNSTLADDITALERKYSGDEIAQALFLNTYTVNSREDPELIPAPYRYRGALLRLILTEDGSKHSFSSSDWKIITSLPDHDDRRFASETLSNLSSLCSTIAVSGGLSTRQKASLISEAEEKSAAALEAHYESVLNSLSEAGRFRFLEEVDNLSANSNIAWSYLDLVGLSETIPEYAEIVISNTCYQVLNSPEDGAETRLLRDAPKLWNALPSR